MAKTKQQIVKASKSERGNLRDSISSTEIARRNTNCSWLPHDSTLSRLAVLCVSELEMIDYWADRASKEVAKHYENGASANWERYKEYRRNLIKRVDNLIDIKIKQCKKA